VTASFNPVTSQTGSTLTLGVPASGVPPGTYLFDVTGTDGTVTQKTPLTLAVTAASSATLLLTATPTSATFARGGGATVGIKITRGGGLTGTVALSATGLPSKASVSFSPASTAGDSSTMTISSLKPVAAGTYPVMVRGAIGSVVVTTTVVVVIQ
jgi:hypothetical protein